MFYVVVDSLANGIDLLDGKNYIVFFFLQLPNKKKVEHKNFLFAISSLFLALNRTNQVLF